MIMLKCDKMHDCVTPVLLKCDKMHDCVTPRVPLAVSAVLFAFMNYNAPLRDKVTTGSA